MISRVSNYRPRHESGHVAAFLATFPFTCYLSSGVPRVTQTQFQTPEIHELTRACALGSFTCESKGAALIVAAVVSRHVHPLKCGDGNLDYHALSASAFVRVFQMITPDRAMTLIIVMLVNSA